MRKLVAATALAATAATAVACSPDTGVRTESAAPSVSAAPVSWKACRAAEGAPAGAECGTVRVPVDWNAPDGDKLDVAVVRRKAADPQRRVGTLLFMPGGPGMSGVETVSGSPEWGGLERRFDVVSFDPRGVGGSGAVKCSTALAEKTAVALKTQASDAAGFRQITDASAALGKDCAGASPATAKLLKHLDATSVARDMEAIRIAIGEKRLSLYGHSYGTVYGQRYAALYGERVRAAVLDGVMNPRISRADFAAQSAKSLEGSFAEFARWCAKDRSCALGGKDAWAVYERVAAKAKAGTLPRSGDSGRPVDLVRLNAEIDGMLLTPSWSALALYLKTLDAGQEWKEDAAEEQAPAKRQDFADMAVCADFRMRSSYDEYAALAARSRSAAPHLGYSPNAVQYLNLCSGFGVEPSPDAGRAERVATKTPLLLINARHDNATPLAWARAVADRLGKNARLVEVDGWGHGMKLFSRGAERDTVVRYLTDLATPEKRVTTVKGDLPPDVAGQNGR
ncbi:alpha/beta fold hydrolase [Streptomyces sp. NPDC059063]|uniref:alpha/beta fold hydrolase n=1 Tax=unclassified Streptomyces TaxID=2593676 RepID=UPI0036AEA832